MNKDQVTGKIDQAVGKVKQSVGEAVGDDELANKGVIDQAKGAVKETWGNVKDAAQQVKESHEEHAAAKADRTRDHISQSIDDTKDKLKDKIEELKNVIQPEICNRGSHDSLPAPGSRDSTRSKRKKGSSDANIRSFSPGHRPSKLTGRDSR